MQILIVVKVYGDCERPADVLKFEEECFADHAGFIEKVSQKATTLFESAKKRLGITSETEPDQKPKKCEYYQCLLKKMHVTNQHNLPELSSLNDRYGQQLASDTSEAKECFAMAENIEQLMESQESTVDVIEHDPGRTIKQARDTMNEILCEISSHVVRCLSKITHKDSKCPLFVFP